MEETDGLLYETDGSRHDGPPSESAMTMSAERLPDNEIGVFHRPVVSDIKAANRLRLDAG